MHASQPASQHHTHRDTARTKYALHARDCAARAKMFWKKVQKFTCRMVAQRFTQSHCIADAHWRPMSRVRDAVSLVRARQRDRERERHKIITQIKCDFGWFRMIPSVNRQKLLFNWRAMCGHVAVVAFNFFNRDVPSGNMRKNADHETIIKYTRREKNK